MSASLLHDLKAYRRQDVANLEQDLSREAVRALAETHTAILAIEAVMAEPEPVRTGPRIEFGEDGYPK